jgi:hypothetical protein
MSNPHAETRELLPWLANGTLAGAELARVRAHLQECPACRERLEWERGLQDGLRAGGRPAPPLSAEQAFAALLPRLGGQEGGADPPAQADRDLQAKPGGKPDRRGGLAAANDAHWLRALAAVQLGVIIVLALVLAAPRTDEPGYRTLGAHAAAAGNIVVSFDPATPEGELRRILQASGGRVADGPTATGAWVLAVEPGGTGPALRRLRAESAVTLAEPLAVEGAR